MNHELCKAGNTVSQPESERPYQPFLFEDMANWLNSPDAKQMDAKFTIDALLKARKLIIKANRVIYLRQVNDAINLIRSLSRLSDTQREEAVLYSIEVQGATTFEEIAGDTRLAIAVVKEVYAKLKEEGRITIAKKYIPGSDRQYYMPKSERVN